MEERRQAPTSADTDDPFPDAGRRSERRRARAAAVRRRRLATLAIVLVIATVLAVLGVRAALSPSGDTATAADTAAATATEATSLETDPPASSTTSVAPATYPPRSLTVRTKPDGAQLTLAYPDGSVEEGVTPFERSVPGGPVTMTLAHAGRNTVTRELSLVADQALTVYLDPTGLLHQSTVRFTTGSAPKQVAFSPDGTELWTSLLGGHGVEIFDPSSGAQLGSVDMGEHGAVEVIFTRDGGTVYASQMESASVFEIDRVARKVLRQLPTEGSWTKVMALSPDEKTLYAANWSSNDVSEIDLVTGDVRRRVPTVVTPRGLYVTDDGRLYVAGYENGEIERIDLATGEGTVLIKTGGAMRHLVGSPDGRTLYADDMATDQVFRVDLATDEVTELAPTDEKPNTIDISPDGKVLYVSCRGENNPESYYIPGPEWGSVLAIDTATGAVLDAIVGGNQCTGLDVSADGTLLAFSDFLDNRVRLYSIPPYETLAAGGGGRAEAHLADIPKN